MIGIGVPSADACHAVGLHPSRFFAWMDERDEDPATVAFRADVLRADGQGVAQQVKILWDGGRTAKDADGRPVVEPSKTLCEQHRFLLGHRRPDTFGGSSGRPAPGPGGPRPESVEPDVAEQIVAVLDAAGVVLPPDVRAVIGVGEPGG